MKTLDEVIDSITKHSGLEIRNVRKPDKDRFWVDSETYMDALNYLRMYRSDKLQWEREKNDMQSRYQEAIDNCEKAENKFKLALKKLDVGTLNEPLTWDELKQMVGKPVWVEMPYKTGSVIGGRWRIVKGVTGRNDELACVHTDEPYDTLWKKRQGVEWVAYRKERS